MGSLWAWAVARSSACFIDRKCLSRAQPTPLHILKATVSKAGTKKSNAWIQTTLNRLKAKTGQGERTERAMGKKETFGSLSHMEA